MVKLRGISKLQVAIVLAICALLTLIIPALNNNEAAPLVYLQQYTTDLNESLNLTNGESIRLDLFSNPVIDNAIVWAHSGERIFPSPNQMAHSFDNALLLAESRILLLAKSTSSWAAERSDVTATIYYYCNVVNNLVCVIVNVDALAKLTSLSATEVRDSLENARTKERVFYTLIAFSFALGAGVLGYWWFSSTAFSRPNDEKFVLRDVTVFPRLMKAKRYGLSVEINERDVKMLRHFYEHPEEVLTKNELYDIAWGRKFVQNSRVVEQHIINLRKKLDPQKRLPVIIETVHGAGYRFTHKVRP